MISELIPKLYTFVLQPVMGLMFGVALIVFLWGVAQFIRGADSEDARRTGGKHILWGIVGMFIMVSVFGILTIISGTVPQGKDEPPRLAPGDLLN